jgi:hypothetical protein
VSPPAHPHDSQTAFLPGIRRLGLLCLLVAWLGVWGCSDSPPAPPVSEPSLAAVELLTFTPDDEHYLRPGHRFPLEPHVRLQEALQRLADQLSRSYFGADQRISDIRIEVLGLYTIDLPHRSLRVVAVDIQDPQQAAWGAFFQGSAGGQTTFYLLAATLMQPQLTPPLADGLVVLYNGAAFPELDHIRFRGIVSAESIRPVVVQAVQRNQPAPSAVSG